MMYNYTYNNHFKFGYLQEDDNGMPVKKLYGQRRSESDEWIIEYGQCNGFSDFRTECISAAEKIYNNRQGAKIDVLFSGGSDSEIVLRSFYELGVDFNVHIMRYDDYLNAHDWSYAYVICQNLNIKPIFHDLNLLKFWGSSQFHDFAQQSKCVSPQLVTHMWLMNRMDNLPVMGSGECYTARADIVLHRSTDFSKTPYSAHVPWVMYEREKIACWYRFPMHHRQNAIPGFFQYTPEIILAFLTDPDSVKLYNNKCRGRLSNKNTKFDIYKKHWPELIDRKKWSGFEKVTDNDRNLRRQLRDLYGDHEYEYWSECNYLVKYMTKQESVFPVNFSPRIRNPGLVNVSMESVKKNLGEYLNY